MQLTLICHDCIQLVTIKEGRTTGLEPASGGITIRCLNHLATLAIASLIIASKLQIELEIAAIWFAVPLCNSNQFQVAYNGCKICKSA